MPTKLPGAGQKPDVRPLASVLLCLMVDAVYMVAKALAQKPKQVWREAEKPIGNMAGGQPKPYAKGKSQWP